MKKQELSVKTPSKENRNDSPLLEESPEESSVLLQRQSSRTLPISAHLMERAVRTPAGRFFMGAGCQCAQCGRDEPQARSDGGSITRPGHAAMMSQESGNADDENDDLVTMTDDSLRLLRRASSSSASPWVLAPMLAATPLATGQVHHNPAMVERLISEYVAACHFYGCGDRVNAGVLTTLRYSLPALRVSGSFHDADMLALSELLLRHVNGHLSYIQRLDFSIGSKEGKLHGKAGFRSHGALALSKVLQQAQHIQQVLLQRNRIGPFGASALFVACCSNPTIRQLVLRRCGVRERGARVFAELVIASPTTGLAEVDLSANGIGWKGSLVVEEALAKRQADKQLEPLNVDMEGNLVREPSPFGA